MEPSFGGGSRQRDYAYSGQNDSRTPFPRWRSHSRAGEEHAFRVRNTVLSCGFFL